MSEKEGELYKQLIKQREVALKELTIDAASTVIPNLRWMQNLLNEAKAEFPILPFPTEKIEFWKMIITQAKIPELTQQQRRELLITILYMIEWFQKWFGDSK